MGWVGVGWVGVGWGGKHVVIMLASPAELRLGLSLAIVKLIRLDSFMVV